MSSGVNSEPSKNAVVKASVEYIKKEEPFQEGELAVEPAKVNVKFGQAISLPVGFASLAAVPVRWTQLITNKAGYGIVNQPRIANYISCHGYAKYGGEYHEVLVFIAKEMIDPNYAWHPEHLSKVEPSLGLDPEEPSVEITPEQQKKLDAAKKLLEQAKKHPGFAVNENWQYGWLNSKERFVVYHPKSRTPYQHRFTGALSESPAALNSLVTAVGAPFANDKFNGGMSATQAAATVAAINAIPYAAKWAAEAYQAVRGVYLVNFKPE